MTFDAPFAPDDLSLPEVAANAAQAAVPTRAALPPDGATPRPFDVVEDGHPWRSAIEALREQIAGRAPPAGSGALVVHAELKGVRDRDGRWRLDRAYWSWQRRDPAVRLGLQGRTLCVDARQAQGFWTEFPADDRLPEAAGWFDGLPPDVRVQVLRHVPLRRLTFRCEPVDGPACIGKFKRRSRYAQAYGLIGAVAAAVARAQAESDRPLGYAVAQPLSLVPHRALYFQQALPGEDLADRLGGAADGAWLGRLGRVHRRLLQLDATGLPSRGPGLQLAQSEQDLAWLAFMQPRHADALRPLREALHRLPEWADGDSLVCHGDLVPSQFLVSGDAAADGPWSVTDFDLCHRGDPCRDVAILLASLAYDVPAFAAAEARHGADLEGLESAYLEGLAHERAPGDAVLPSRRLAWQRLCAEIHYLALMVRKDRLVPIAFERRLRRAQRIAGVRDWT